MRRLLTGYAVTYNHRHRRHGQLFQNRYKSILCQGDPYLLELIRVAGYDLEKLATHAAKVSGLKMEDLLRPGRYEKVVVGRSLFCYWAVREFGVSATELAKRIGISQPAVSYSVQRGEKLARENALDLLPK
jgi:hypothetical protein